MTFHLSLAGKQGVNVCPFTLESSLPVPWQHWGVGAGGCPSSNPRAALLVGGAWYSEEGRRRIILPTLQDTEENIREAF